MLSIQEVRKEYRDLINEDQEKNRKGALALKDNMERSPLYFRDRFASKTLQIPRLYSEEMVEQFREIVSASYRIFGKVIREYLSHADYRALFPFSKELEELILLPRGYEEVLPIARFDIFYHEDTGEFYFCEINTDGTSGMNEDRLQDVFILDNPAHQEMRRRYRFRTFELFDSWVDAFMKLYRTYEKQTENPNIAIIDFLDTGTLREFQEFARHFQKAGYNCEICDIRELQFENGRLLSPSGHGIDAVYRRAVTTDIMEHKEEVKPFLEAVRKGAFFMAGSFCTQIIHHKYLFHILHLPRTMQFLTEEEQRFIRKHVPRTVPFGREYIAREEVVSGRERFILKPEDSYGSSGVHAGVECSQEEWEQIVGSTYENGYICQDYVPQYASDNIDFAFGDGKWHSYITMAGLFVYCGNFAGVFSRAAEGDGIIASHRNERTQATYMVSRFE